MGGIAEILGHLAISMLSWTLQETNFSFYPLTLLNVPGAVHRD